ncbi:MAG: leucine-rich repeat domain-containing protein [Oscillospiraceae bacterium]|nr:leucine-rich repeat domain-containing protein [Oscillospiraceae bacterium]
MRNAALCLVPLMLLLCSCGSVPKTQEVTSSLADSDAVPADSAEAPQEAVPTQEPEVDPGATPLASFGYELREDGTAAITDFHGKETRVVVPAMIGDCPVTEIGQYAFEAAWDVQEIVLPDSVHFIGEQAFLDCESLTAVNIPSVPVLYRATFAGCTSLSSVTIPASVTETYEELFSGCPIQDLYVENAALTYESWGLEDAPCTVHAPEGAAIFDWAQSAGKSTAVIGGEPPLADAS